MRLLDEAKQKWYCYKDDQLLFARDNIWGPPKIADQKPLSEDEELTEEEERFWLEKYYEQYGRTPEEAAKIAKRNRRLGYLVAVGVAVFVPLIFLFEYRLATGPAPRCDTLPNSYGQLVTICEPDLRPGAAMFLGYSGTAVVFAVIGIVAYEIRKWSLRRKAKHETK